MIVIHLTVFQFSVLIRRTAVCKASNKQRQRVRDEVV